MNTTQTPFIGLGLRHPHYAQVLEQQPALDFLEVHAENFFALGGASLQVLDQVRQTYPLSLHGVGLSLGSAKGIDPWHLQQLSRLVQRTQPLLISDHACFAAGHMQGKAVHANDLLPIRWTHDSLNVLCANVAQVQDTLKRSISVENISAYVQWAHADFSETDFLNSLCERTGCGILLDLNNIFVNALNHVLPQHRIVAVHEEDKQSFKKTLYEQAEQDCLRWIDHLHSHCVTQIHLAGFTPNDHLVIDDHAQSVDDSVWRLYAYTLKKTGHVPTLVEWDLELPELSVLLGETDKARALAATISL